MRMKKHFFIAGTDTDVGKTHITCCLLRDLIAKGQSAIAYKPIACGDRSDARAIREASGDAALSLDLINPCYLRSATAPSIAAELEQKYICITSLEEGYEKLCSLYDIVLVEGVGGWYAPLDSENTMADLAERLQLPVILVVENKLGALNHTLLTLEAIAKRGLTCHGIILNHREEEWNLATLTNRRQLEQHSNVPILAELISGQDELDSSVIVD